jgi:hypothetical protein
MWEWFIGFVGDSVRNTIVIDVKDRGRIHMSKIKIAIWRLLEILFLDF